MAEKSTVTEPPSMTLGEYLGQARKILGLSLAAVAEAASISPAYQKKLEEDGVKQPSPNVLHREAKVLRVPYSILMQLAGYLMPDSDAQVGDVSSLDYALSSADLTDEERKAVAAFIGHLRQQRE